MRIINRRSLVEYVVTKDQWEQMVVQQTSKLFKITDSMDNGSSRLNVPKIIEEFKINRPERIKKVEETTN